MRDPLTAGPGAVHVALQTSSLLVLSISYKDKNELFSKLKNALIDRNIPMDSLYALDRNRQRMPLDNPDNLFVTSDGSDTVLLYSKAASDDYNHRPENKAHPGRSRSSSDTSYSIGEHSRHKHRKHQSKRQHCPCQFRRSCGQSISSPLSPCHQSGCSGYFGNPYQISECSRCHSCCCY